MNKSGITLTELIISTSIVGIVMLGVVGVDYAVRNTEKTGRDITLTEIRLLRMMEHMMDNAAHAIGTSANPGIVITNIGNNNSNSICFRLDDDNNLMVSGADQWRCYTRRTNNLHYCVRGSTGQCNAATTVIGEVTADTYDDPPSTIPSFTIDNAVGTQKMEFNVTLMTRPDPSAADDPTSNPTRAITSSVSPSLHGY